MTGKASIGNGSWKVFALALTTFVEGVRILFEAGEELVFLNACVGVVCVCV